LVKGGCNLFKKDYLDTPLDKVNTIIGKDIFLKGDIKGKGLIRIDGHVQGSITNSGDVIIGESGQVEVDLKARNVTIAGNYNGTLEAEGRLELKKTARIKGTFKVNGLLVEDGAIVSGSLDMKMGEQGAKTVVKHKFSQELKD